MQDLQARIPSVVHKLNKTCARLLIIIIIMILVILDMEVRGVEAFFLCLFSDNSVSYVSYRNILYGPYELYKLIILLLCIIITSTEGLIYMIFTNDNSNEIIVK